MKTIILVFLLSVMAFGQSGKSNLTQQQKDSIGAMIRDSLSSFNYSITLINPYITAEATFDYTIDSLVIDSVFTVIKDSSITYNISFSQSMSSSFTDLFSTDQIVTNKTTGSYTSSISNAEISRNSFIKVSVSDMGGEYKEELFIKLFCRKIQ